MRYPGRITPQFALIYTLECRLLNYLLKAIIEGLIGYQ